jgi:transcriptional regulator with XRE-family HTH domain
MSPLKQVTMVDVASWRYRMNMSQADLGETLGVSGNTISRWERGEVVPESPKMLALALRAIELDRAFSAPDFAEAAERFRRRPKKPGVWNLLPPEERKRAGREE